MKRTDPEERLLELKAKRILLTLFAESKAGHGMFDFKEM